MKSGNIGLEKKLERLRSSVIERENNTVVQLPLWPEPKRGAPNSFIRSALFAAIQSKDRKFMKEVVLASQDGITIKFTGEQLNQADLDVWETIVHLAREQPLGTVAVLHRAWPPESFGNVNGQQPTQAASFNAFAPYSLCCRGYT